MYSVVVATVGTVFVCVYMCVQEVLQVRRERLAHQWATGGQQAASAVSMEVCNAGGIGQPPKYTDLSAISRPLCGLHCKIWRLT